MLNTEEYEHSLIGAICKDCRVIDEVASILTTKDFVIQACAEIYDAACDAVSRGKVFDAASATDVIRTRMENPMRFILNCIDLCPSSTQAMAYAKEIHKRAQLRNLDESITEILMAADGGNIDPDSVAAEITGICQTHLTTGSTQRYKTMNDALQTVYNRVTNPQKEKFLETGFTRLDALLKGMPKGNLIFVGARPSVGKSAFALSIAEHVARTNGIVMLYSLEMLADECAERSVAKMSGIEMDKLIDCDIGESQLTTLGTVCGKLSDLPINIFDCPNVTPSMIRRDARMFKDVKLIIVDFISLMSSDKKNPQNRNLELGAISRDLKNLAVELDVPILALSQLNRNTDEKTEPQLSDLRDSGELEQNSNKVILLWLLEKLSDGTKQIGVSIAKNRRGRTGAVSMEFDGSHMCFNEIDYLKQQDAPKTKQKYGAGIIKKKQFEKTEDE